MSRLYDDLETMLRDRGIRQRDDGSFGARDREDLRAVETDEVELAGLRLVLAHPAADPRQPVRPELGVEPPDAVVVRVLGDLDPKRSLAARDYEAVGVSVGSARGSVELLCIIPPEESRPSARVDVLLAGWADACGTPDSVAWIRDKVAIAIVAGLAYHPGKEPSHA